MKGLIVVILLSVLLRCSGDVSQGRNLKLPFSPQARIPSLTQSLLPPTFENPIKDYTVGLVPPPVDSRATRTEPEHRHHFTQVPIHQQPTRYATELITPAKSLKTIAQHRGGYPVGPVRTAVNHQTHQITNLVQPQVHQPKIIVYPQPNALAHHHSHHHQQQYRQSNGYSTGLVIPQAAPHRVHHSAPTPQYYGPITHGVVHQHSAHAHYASVPPVALPTISGSTLPRVTQFQTYPSISYTASVQQHGSTLNLGNANLEPELVQIIGEVLDRHHF